MLPLFLRGSKPALVLALSAAYIGWYGHARPAYAQAADDDEDSGGDDEDTGKTEESEEEEDKEQPLVTAGGLFTLKTYPQRELLRPLTMTEGITQIRVGVGTDISAKGAFESAGGSIEAQYGARDNVTVIGGITNAYNFKQFGFYAGIEGSLLYDLVDFRIAANVHRSAIPRYCTDPGAPANCTPADGGMPLNIPSGKYDAGGTKFSIDLGFPFRYAIKPEIAIIALQTLMTIDFNAVDLDHVAANDDGTLVPVGNGAKPDLAPSVGVALSPIPALSVVAFAQMKIPDFDTSAGGFQIPVTGRVEFSPSQKLDIGLEFVLLNVKPPKDQSPIDNRFISLFAQFRMGK